MQKWKWAADGSSLQEPKPLIDHASPILSAGLWGLHQRSSRSISWPETEARLFEDATNIVDRRLNRLNDLELGNHKLDLDWEELPDGRLHFFKNMQMSHSVLVCPFSQMGGLSKQKRNRMLRPSFMEN
jgi:hypothetical protein